MGRIVAPFRSPYRLLSRALGDNCVYSNAPYFEASRAGIPVISLIGFGHAEEISASTVINVQYAFLQVRGACVSEIPMNKVGVAGPNLQNTLDRTSYGRTPLDLAIDAHQVKKLHSLIRDYKMLTRGASATDLWYGGEPYHQWRNRARPRQEDRSRDWKTI